MTYSFIIFLLLFFGVIIFMYMKTGANNFRTKPSTNKAKSFNTKYHCVMIQFDDQACELVKSLKGKRLLTSNLVGLPIQGCKAKKCNCRYVHYDDRRDMDRRQTPYLASLAHAGDNVERSRKARDRRRI